MATGTAWQAERVNWSPLPSTSYFRSVPPVELVTPYRRFFWGKAGAGLSRSLAWALGIEEDQVAKVTELARRAARESGFPVRVTGASGRTVIIAYNPGAGGPSGRKRTYDIVTDES